MCALVREKSFSFFTALSFQSYALVIERVTNFSKEAIIELQAILEGNSAGMRLFDPWVHWALTFNLPPIE